MEKEKKLIHLHDGAVLLGTAWVEEGHSAEGLLLSASISTDNTFFDPTFKVNLVSEAPLKDSKTKELVEWVCLNFYYPWRAVRKSLPCHCTMEVVRNEHFRQWEFRFYARTEHGLWLNEFFGMTDELIKNTPMDLLKKSLFRDCLQRMFFRPVEEAFKRGFKNTSLPQ